MFHQVSAKKKKLMKPSWSPHSHHFSWRKSWRSPRISQGPMGRHWESPPWRSRGRWKSRNARPAEDPSRICSICCWKETIWLVGGYTYSEKWWSLSVGMMTFPTEWKHKSHVPNHQPDDFGAVGKSSTKHWWKSLAGRPFPSCAATEMAQFQAELNVKYLASSSQSIDWNKARELQLQLISPRPPSPATLKVIVDIDMDKSTTCRWFPPQKKITWTSSVSVKPGTNIGV